MGNRLVPVKQTDLTHLFIYCLARTFVAAFCYLLCYCAVKFIKKGRIHEKAVSQRCCVTVLSVWRKADDINIRIFGRALSCPMNSNYKFQAGRRCYNLWIRLTDCKSSNYHKYFRSSSWRGHVYIEIWKQSFSTQNPLVTFVHIVNIDNDEYSTNTFILHPSLLSFSVPPQSRWCSPISLSLSLSLFSSVPS